MEQLLIALRQLLNDLGNGRDTWNERGPAGNQWRLVQVVTYMQQID